MSGLFVQPELPENWTDTKETLLEGMVFNVKYLGMTLVGQPKGEDMASAAIRRIVATVSHWSLSYSYSLIMDVILTLTFYGHFLTNLTYYPLIIRSTSAYTVYMIVLILIFANNIAYNSVGKLSTFNSNVKFQE